MMSPDETRARRPADVSPFSSIYRRFAQRLRRRRSLDQMEDLNEHLLRDIGMTKWDVRDMRRHW